VAAVHDARDRSWRLPLIVRHVDKRRPEFALEPFEFFPLQAELEVERAQRPSRSSTCRSRARASHTLLLATGQF
jgi:hypothetical protein